MEYLTTEETTIKVSAAILGIVQGLAWIVMSIICCVYVHKGTDLNDLDGSYMNFVTYLIKKFISGSLNLQEDLYFSHFFIIVAAIYIILDVIWIGVSLNIFFRHNNKLNSSLKLWSGVTLVICLWDFSVVIVLGDDYNKCLSSNTSVLWDPSFDDLPSIVSGGMCANTILPVLVIAAKGFVLWLINLAFSIILFRIQPKLKLTTSQFPVSLGNIPPQPNNFQPQQIQTPSTPYQNPQTPNYPVSNLPAVPPSPNYRWNGSPQNDSVLDTPNLQNWMSESPNLQNQNRNIPRYPNQNKLDSPNVSRFQNPQNWRRNFVRSASQEVSIPGNAIVSNQTQKPFVLHSPPRRY